MKFLIFIILYLLTPAYSWCQYFYKTHPEERTATFLSIKEQNSRIFISTATLCPNWECSLISEYDDSGTKVWTTFLPNMDIGVATLKIKNDTIYLGGNYFPGQGKSIINRISLDGSIIDDFIYFDSLNQFDYSLINFLNLEKNKIYFSGQCFKNDKSKALIYSINDKMEIKQLLIDTTKENSLIYDAFVGPDSLLTCFINQSNKFRPFDVRRIEKYDKDLNLVWKYIPDTLLSNMINIHGTVLNDGRIVYTYFTWGYPSRLPNVRCLDTVSKQNIWQYDYPKVSQHARHIYRMKQLKNGDILLIGEYVSKVAAPHINGSPYMMRLDLNGTRKWERTYVEWDTDGEDKGGALWDAIELENGDLMAVGFVRNNGKWDPLLIRTDADGCIDQSTPSCPTVQIFDLMTGAVDVIGDRELVLYPNPASTQISIKGEDLVFPLFYSIYNSVGQVISSGHTDAFGTIHIDFLPAGLYLIQLKDKKGYVRKVPWMKE